MDRGHVYGAAQSAGLPRLSLLLSLVLLSVRERDLREPPGKRSLLESQCEISGRRLLRLDWSVEAPIKAGQCAISPFLASLPFCVRPSHRLGEKRRRREGAEKKGDRRALGRGEKNREGGGRRASIFAFEGTVAVVRAHLPLRI